jgi:plasmid stability protein
MATHATACRVDAIKWNRYGSIMATITLKNIPIAVHRALKAQARANGRSLNREAIVCLEGVLLPRPVDRAALLERIRRSRSLRPAAIDESFLRRAKALGRP